MVHVYIKNSRRLSVLLMRQLNIRKFKYAAFVAKKRYFQGGFGSFELFSKTARAEMFKWFLVNRKKNK